MKKKNLMFIWRDGKNLWSAVAFWHVGKAEEDVQAIAAARGDQIIDRIECQCN